VERSATYGSTTPNNIKPCKGEIIIVSVDNLAPCGAYVFLGRDPAVALRFTAGYAHYTPCGVKIPVFVRKQKFVA
jgi:hypothetical protein